MRISRRIGFLKYSIVLASLSLAACGQVGGAGASGTATGAQAPTGAQATSASAGAASSAPAQSALAANLADGTGPRNAPKELWHGESGDKYAGYTGHDLVFVTMAGGSSTIIGVNAVTGSQDWTFSAADLPAQSIVTSGVVAAGGAVYALVNEPPFPANDVPATGIDTVIAFTPGTHKPLWSTPLGSDTVFPDELIVSGGYLLAPDSPALGTADGYYQFTLATGEPHGHAGSGASQGHDGFYASQNQLFNASTGKPVALPGDVCGWNGSVIVTGGGSGSLDAVTATNEATMSQAWASSNPVYCLTVTGNGEVIVDDSANGQFEALDASNGSQRWTMPEPADLGNGLASYTAEFVGGGIILFDADGPFVAIG